MNSIFSEVFPAGSGVRGTARPVIDTATVDSLLSGTVFDDDVLSPQEKVQLIVPANDELESGFSEISSRANLAGLDLTALNAARNNYISLRNSISPAWNNTNVSSNIGTIPIREAIVAYRNALKVTELNLNQTIADGKVETYFTNEAPVGASIGDLWFDTNDGNKLYRWNGSTWVSARDSEISQAISDAANAQTTADGKITTYYQNEEPSGASVGDLWVDINDGNKMYRYSGSSWVSIRDAGITQAISDAAGALAAADGKIDSFFQPEPPVGAGVGDLWFDTNDGNKQYIWDGSAWALAADSRIATAINNIATVDAKADGKISTFYQNEPPSAQAVGDLWVDTNDKNRLYRWSGVAWTDVRDLSISDALAAAANAQSTADGKIVTYFQNDAPVSASLGDLWFDTNDGNKQYRFNGTSWVIAADTQIGAAIANAATAQATANGKVTTFYSSSAPVAEAQGDLWYNIVSFEVRRWTGSSWVLISDITAQKVAAAISGQGSLATKNWVTLGSDLRNALGTVTLSDFDVITGESLNAGELPNFNFDIIDKSGLPAGFDLIEASQAITREQVVEFTNPSRAAVRLKGGYNYGAGFIAIPIDDKRSYIFTIRHRSTGPHSAGLYIRLNERASALPSGEKFVTGALRDSLVDLRGNTPMPGTDWVQETMTYAPTPGTKFASLSFYNWGAPVDYEIDFARMNNTIFESRVNALALSNAPGEAGANVTENRVAYGIQGQGTLATQSNVSWTAQVAGRPVELTDGRISSGLTSAGFLKSGINAGGPLSLAPSELFSLLSGTSIIFDPEFQKGTIPTETVVYNNIGNSVVSIAVITDEAAPNSSKKVLRVTYDASGDTTPGFGGFSRLIQDAGAGSSVRTNRYTRGSVYLVKIVAKIPVGRNIEFASNPFGNESSFVWLTGQAGTGNYETYFARQTIGTTGSFQVTGFFYINGGPVAPFTWDVAVSDYIEMTGANRLFLDQGIITGADGIARLQNQLVTSEGVASAIQGQGTLATLNSINLDNPSVVSLPSRLSPSTIHGPNWLSAVNVAWEDVGGGTVNGWKPQEPNANITENRVANAISGQTSWATFGAPTSKLDYLSPSGSLKFGIGGGITNNIGSAWITDEIAITSLGTASAIANQGAWATTGIAIADVTRPGANLLYNASLKLLTQGWVSDANFEQSVDGNRFIAYGPSNDRRARTNDDYRLPAWEGLTVTLSGEFIANGSTASFFGVEYFNSSGAYITGTYSNVSGGWNRDKIVATCPPGTSRMGVMWSGGNVSAGMASGMRRMKLEYDNRITPVFTDEATYGALYQSGATIDVLRPAEFGSNITENRVAQAISGQSPWATFGAPTAKLNYLQGDGTLRLGNGGGLLSEAADYWITNAVAVTSLGTSAAIAGQGPGATASANDVLNNRKEGDLLRIPKPVGATFGSYSPNVVGAIRIRLPQGWTNTMMQFTVDLFDYTIDRTVSLVVAGYNYAGDGGNPASAQWVNWSAYILGGSGQRYPVRFGLSDGTCCVWIGNPDTVWQYPKVSVRDFTGSHSNFDVGQWDDGWSIDIDTIGARNNSSGIVQGVIHPTPGDALFGANIFEGSGLGVATTGNFKTQLGTSAAIANQGAFATINQVDLDNSARIYQPPRFEASAFGGTWFRADRVAWAGASTVEAWKPQEPSANITENRVSSAISGQTAWATFSSPTTKVQYLTSDGRMRLGEGNGLVNAANTLWLTDSGVITNQGTAAAFANQGALATRSNVTSAHLTDGLIDGDNLIPNAQFIDGLAKWYVDGNGVLDGSDGVAGWPGRRAVRFDPGAAGTAQSADGQSFPIQNNGRVHVSGWYWVNEPSNGRPSIIIRTHGNDGAILDYLGITAPSMATGWNFFGGWIALPASARRLMAYWQVGNDRTGSTYVTNMRVAYTAPGATLGAQAGVDTYRADGVTVMSQAELRTAEGTAAAIAGQTVWATSGEPITKLGYLKTDGTFRFGVGQGLLNEAANAWITDAAAITSLGTAAAFANQGALATKNTAAYSTDVSGRPTNLGNQSIIPGERFDDLSPWGNLNLNVAGLSDERAVYSTAAVQQQFVTVFEYSQPVDFEATYEFSYEVYQEAGASAPFYSLINLYDSVQANITGDGSYWYYPVANQPVPQQTAWVKYSHRFGKGTIKPLPSNAFRMGMGMLMNYGGVGAGTYVRRLRVRKIPMLEWSDAHTGALSIDGDRIVKGYGWPGSWGSVASSRNTITGPQIVSASPVVAGASGDVVSMVGLSDDTVTSYANIDYAWYITSAGFAQIYESGGYVTEINSATYGLSYSTAKFSVEYDGVWVRYLLNQVVIRSVNAGHNRTFRAAVDINYPGAGLSNIIYQSTRSASVVGGNTVRTNGSSLGTADLVTPEGTAAAIANQGAFATQNTVNLDNSSLVSLPARFEASVYGGTWLRADRVAWAGASTVEDLKPQDINSNRTENRVAAAIVGQKSGATASSIAELNATDWNRITGMADTNNMIRNSYNLNDVVFSGGSVVREAFTPGNGPARDYFRIRHDPSQSICYFNSGDQIPVRAGERLYAEITVYHAADGGAIGYLYLRFRSANQTHIADVVLPHGAGNGTGNWFRRKFSGVVPAGAALMEVFTYTANHSSGAIYFTEPFLTRYEDGADVTSLITGTPSIEVSCNSAGTPNPGVLPLYTQYRLFRNGADVTTSSSWAVTVLSGGVSGAINSSNGILAISSISSNTARLRLTATHQSLVRTFDVDVSKNIAPPSVTGGGGGGTSAVDTSLSGIGSTSLALMSDELTISTGSSGTVTINLSTDYSAGEYDGGSSIGNHYLYAIAEEWNGSAWVAIMSEVEGFPAVIDPEPPGYLSFNGSVGFQVTLTGRAANSSYKYRLRGRGSSSRNLSVFNSSFQVVGS